MAEVCGIDENQLSKYANGVKRPELEQLQKLESTGINIHWLLTGRGDPDAPLHERDPAALFTLLRKALAELEERTTKEDSPNAHRDPP